MPTYYFTILNGEEQSIEDDGIELASLDEVRKLASRTLADIASDEATQAPEFSVSLVVRDEKKRQVLHASLLFRAYDT